ncbi:MAG: PhnD/SsuA/transferrin family substrate-binding protein, partial [Desulfobulbaceae bacterium]|nr:PhnD/SsuA/transferrin family substrate-binding protein [Candidatus Desulfatifera sulfidica]
MPHWSLTYLLFALMLMDPHAAFAGKVNTGGPSELIPEISQTDQTVIKIGILAKRGREQILTKWSPTATYLERVIPGYRFTIAPLDFTEINTAVRSQSIDFVLANPAFYVELEKKHGLSRIATLINQNLPDQQTAIF